MQCLREIYEIEFNNMKEVSYGIPREIIGSSFGIEILIKMKGNYTVIRVQLRGN